MLDQTLEIGRVRAVATRWTIGVVALMMGVAVSASVLFAMRLRRRLSDLEDATEALARGDFDQRAPSAGDDEIGRLARSFNAMADQVQGRTLEAAGLRRVSELPQACGTVEEAFEVTEGVVPSLLPESRGVIHVINASRSLLEVASRFGLSCDADAGSSEPAIKDRWCSWCSMSTISNDSMTPTGMTRETTY